MTLPHESDGAVYCPVCDKHHPMPYCGEARTLRLLAETSAALKRALSGQRTWLEADVLRDSWEFCQARGINDPADPAATAGAWCSCHDTDSGRCRRHG